MAPAKAVTESAAAAAVSAKPSIQAAQVRPSTLAPQETKSSASAPTMPALKKKKGPGYKAGDHIRHYEIIRPLGKGGMGSVFLARDSKLGRRVAIKLLNTENPDLVKRFIVEARATARCNHENIVIIYDADEINGRPYMVLEYLQGAALTRLIVEGKPLAPGRAVELMVPVVRALACAHGQGIVHRDLKPDNVVVTDSGTIKVLDFGIAKVLQGEERAVEQAHHVANKPRRVEPEPDADISDNDTADFDKSITDLTRHGAIMGTLLYMSPEQWGIGVPIDHRTDIWAVGIILFRMLAGKHPLDGLSGMSLSVTGKLEEKMPSLKAVAPQVPTELCDVVDRCLKKKKEERFPDALALLRALEPFLPGRFTRELKIDESPYAGLASFQEADADRFFGRTAEVAALVNKVRDQALIAVVGPSGAGKSSFVRAGVVPALKRSGESWDAVLIRPGRDPLAALASVLAPMLSTSSTVADDLQEQKQLVGRLREEPGFAGSVLRSRARRDKKNILLFVDQFEELFTLVGDWRERLAFTACLSTISDDATSPTRVVVSVRSDFLDRIAEDQGFMAELSRGLFFLSAPGREGLKDALVQPAEMAGYRFETPEIVDDMLTHLASTQGALPLLQFAAMKLWESRDPARKLLTDAAYKGIGGIAGALASHADAVISELSPNARGLAKTLFLRLVTPERTRAIVPLDELRELSAAGGEIQRLLDHLVQARLIVVQTGGGVAQAEIVHESLIQSWPTLRRWLDETGEDAAFLEQLRTAAKQWLAKGKAPDLLWRGELVEEARRFQRRYRGELPLLLSQFLEAIFSLEARAARRKRMGAVVGVAVLLMLLAAATVALVVIRNAQQMAEKQADAARVAEAEAKKARGEAEDRLEQVQKKERERAEAQAKAEKAKEELQAAYKQLLDSQKQLSDALVAEREAKGKAKNAQKQAEKNAHEARRQSELAAQRAQELEQKYQQEQARVKKLEEAQGGVAIDELKK
jgi:serine/threonine protein kinase